MKILSNVPLKNKTTFKCGGTAKWFSEPTDFLEFETLLKLHKGKLFILGAGSKTLCADEGFDGLVIKWSFLIILSEQKEAKCSTIHVLSHFSRVQLIDCSPPGFSAHGILQARVLE